MDKRKLAYKNTPGAAHGESSWIESRKWLEGETEDKAKAWLQAEINAGRVIVVEMGGSRDMVEF